MVTEGFLRMEPSFFSFARLLPAIISFSLGAFLCFPLAAAEKCLVCKKMLTGKFIQAGKAKLHPNCFRCGHCRLPIDQKFRRENNQFLHTHCFRKITGLVCAHCGKVLDEKWVSYSGKKYHQDCYIKYIQPQCGICRLKIDSQYTSDDGLKYHVNCYRQHKLPKCILCVHPLEGTFLVDPWGNRFHSEHQGKSPTCFSCGRIISQVTTRGGRRLNDGRHICRICSTSAISTATHVRKARDSVIKVLKSVGIDSFPKEVSIRLVDRFELNRVSKGLSLHLNGEMRGLTQSVETLEGRTRVATKHTIYLLEYLPALELEGILAHELLHVWLFERKIKLRAQDTEGFCNLGNYLVYSRKPSPMASYLLKNLQDDEDPIYGVGYRNMRRKLNAQGWELLIEGLVGSVAKTNP